MAHASISILRKRSGRIKIATLLFLVVLAVGTYFGIEVGGVFFRKMKLEESIRQHISFAGQLEDAAIRQQIIGEIRSMGLPPQAQQVGITRTASPRVLHITVAYSETVNLLVTQREIPVRIQINRGF